VATSRKERRIYRVGEVNRAVKDALESNYPDFWVEGEVSDFRRSGPGHFYFALNDERERAQLQVVMFQRDARRARAEIRDGARIKVRGGLSIFEPRGRFQLIGRIALPAGEGDLAAAFEKVRKRLQAEGLLDPTRKRALPAAPRVIGVVTSLQGAALQDVVRVAHARAPVRLVVADARVQGAEAPRSIVHALRRIQRLEGREVVILTRGGGSAEDLAAFSDERVARAVAACRVPIVCGVGHETDVCIAELVADERASTPSNAAELVVPELDALFERIRILERKLQRAMEVRVGGERMVLERLRARVSDPRQLLSRAHRERHVLESAMVSAQRARQQQARGALEALTRRLGRHDPRRALVRDRGRLSELGERLRAVTRGRLATERQDLLRAASAIEARRGSLVPPRRGELGTLAARLDALSPLRVLERGYAIAFDATGRALRSAAATSPGERLRLKLHEGEVVVRVEEE